MAEIQLGVLDLQAQPNQGLGYSSIDASIHLAQLSDALGYSRYWIAEHHDHNAASSSPEVMITALAGATKRIKVGSGGILLRHRNPYLVAQAFSLLSKLYPLRIDLGIARGGIGSDNQRYFAGSDTSTETLEAKIATLVRLFRDDELSRCLRPLDCVPDIWLIGATGGAKAARANATAFCFDYLYQSPPDRVVRKTLRDYVDCPSWAGRLARHAVAVAGVCANTTREAEKHVLHAGRQGFPLSTFKHVYAGTPGMWREFFVEKQQQWKTNEFIVLVTSHEVEVQRRSLELLSKVMNLSGRSPSIASIRYFAGSKCSNSKTHSPANQMSDKAGRSNHEAAGGVGAKVGDSEDDFQGCR